MKKSFLFVVLAVTKTYDGYCIAGMDKNGRWIRPLPTGRGKFWSSVKYPNQEFIKVGDVWSITRYEKAFDNNSPGHTEDIRLTNSPILKNRLTNSELLEFVRRHQEGKEELSKTLDADARSLCLVKVDHFEHFIHKNTFDGKRQPRISFSYMGERYNNTTNTPGYPITDLKWRTYTLEQIPVDLSFKSQYICIGLARTEPKKGFTKEFPMVISVITDPEVPLLPTYPK